MSIGDPLHYADKNLEENLYFSPHGNEQDYNQYGPNFPKTYQRKAPISSVKMMLSEKEKTSKMTPSQVNANV